MSNAAATLNLDDRVDYWNKKADTIRKRIEQFAWNDDLGHYVSAFDGDASCASHQSITVTCTEPATASPISIQIVRRRPRIPARSLPFATTH